MTTIIKNTLLGMAISLLLCGNMLAQEIIIFNGGITIAERQSAPEDGTKLSFFVQAGNYLSNVKVIVQTTSGEELVNTVTNGPWLILDLPSGTYQVIASISNGETQSLPITITDDNQEFGFMFRSVQ